MNTVQKDFAPVAHSTDAKEWAARFVLIHYLREDFRSSVAQIEEMFEIAFNAARQEAKHG